MWLHDCCNFGFPLWPVLILGFLCFGGASIAVVTGVVVWFIARQNKPESSSE